MSVVVQNLSKNYGTQRAVADISFEARAGEILGFLGPNGAGKTTTMKILTGYLAADGGSTNVCGYNSETHPMEVRARIGYLPEHNPLYIDMYVREYLQFVGRLNKIPTAALSNRIADMVQLTGLSREQHKKIGQLSKGYRQRVGLAQAMLHDPQVLILDEPTSGLDPNQLAEIRAVIKEAGKEKTVIFSTHIMQEVQALCDRVVIINRGQLVADSTVAQLQQQQSGQIVTTVEFTQPITAEQLLRDIPKLQGVLPTETPQMWQLLSADTHDIRPAVFQFAVQHQYVIITLQRETRNLEDTFRQLTATTTQ